MNNKIHMKILKNSLYGTFGGNFSVSSISRIDYLLRELKRLYLNDNEVIEINNKLKKIIKRK